MITPSAAPATNAIQLSAVRKPRMPKLGVAPKTARYKPAKVGGFAAPKVPSIAPQT